MKTSERSHLEEKLGHHFANPKLLDRALTHASAVAGPARRQPETYQRLEFLGDRVLGLVIADALIERFPEAPEGELSRRLARLVSRETCTEVAEAMGLAEHLKMGGGVRKGGAAATPSVLADVCEAVIAAVYRDGGLEPRERWSSATGVRASSRHAGRSAMPRRSCRNGRTSAASTAGLRRDASDRPRPPAGIRDRGHGRRGGAGKGEGRLEARSGARSGGEPASPRGRVEGVSETPTRAGFVALIGAPNAGKSTLLNAAVGAKLSIVTHKVQTTRALIRGIVIHDHAQIVFVDTPGIFAPKRRLDRAMVTTAWGGAADADVLALLIDAKQGITDEDRAILEKLAGFPAKRERLLILNKVDLVKRDTLLALAKEANEAGRFARTFMISALTGDGVSDLLDYLAAAMPEGPFLYPEDQMTDLPLRFLAAEITREKLTLRLHDELPYRVDGRNGKVDRDEEGRAHRPDDLRGARQASGRSCSAKAARRSRRSRWRRARRYRS